MNKRTGTTKVHRAPGTITEIVNGLQSALGATASFGSLRYGVAVNVSEVIALETEEPWAPKAVTRADFVAASHVAQVAKAAERDHESEHRAAYRGGCEVVQRSSDQTRSTMLARPSGEIIAAIVFASEDPLRLDNGLGGIAVIRPQLVVDVRPID